MYKYIILIVLVFSSIFSERKILHLTFHRGCAHEIEYVAHQLQFNLTTWFIPDLPKKSLDPQSWGNVLYNIGHARAERIWNKHKDFFNQFDAIITSDTAPLSRIFLQNHFQKPLIIWVCNRFDYYDKPSLDCVFPDKEYYQLVDDANKNKKVRIVSYTKFEQVYASQKKVNLGKLIIKPCGGYIIDQFSSGIPTTIDKNATFFIPPYQNDKNFKVGEECKKLGIKNYRGRYNGPEDLKDFKGIIHLPYAWSNLALFENLHNGLIYFIPTKNFIYTLARTKHYFFNYFFLRNQWQYAEWYLPENKELFVYFNSWADLKHKIQTTNYTKLREKILNFGKKHEQETINKWQQIFNELL